MKLLTPVRCTLHDTLRKLKNRHNCVGIKTSFEDEGARVHDIIKLRTLTANDKLKLAIKVGGAEAKTDIRLASELCSDSIVGPMIETPYAFEKFAKAAMDFDGSKGVNLETITALGNIDLILSSQYLDYMDYFVIGRVDLVGSAGQTRKDIDSFENLKLIEDVFTKIKSFNKLTYMGGFISKDSKNNIRYLYEKGLLDYIETRYIIMKLDEQFFDNYDEAIRTSHEFELEWSQFLHSRYINTTTALSSRIDMIKPRVWRSFTIQDTTVCYNLDDIKNKLVVKSNPRDYIVEFIDDTINNYIKNGDFVIVDEKLKGFVAHDFVYTVEAHEENKTLDTVIDIINYVNNRHINRIVVIGGGLVQDVGAFTSSILNRGIPWVYFPTTLLAMADSCIGSKTSLNMNVKNKIGTFSSPEHVYINTAFLDSLSKLDIASGMGEILKLCIISNAVDLYEKNRGDIVYLIKLSLLIKRSVIEIDQFDKGIRKGLNYGHTIGHAIEVMSNFSVPHGIAVVYGMMCVNKMFGAQVPEALFKELVQISKVNATTDSIKTILLGDKKACKDSVMFIVLVKPGVIRFETRAVTDTLCIDIKNILSNV